MTVSSTYRSWIPSKIPAPSVGCQWITKAIFRLIFSVLRRIPALIMDATRRSRAYLDRNVDAVEQGTRDAAAVSRHLIRRALALPAVVAEIAAGARIHRCHQLEAGRKVGLLCRTRDRDAAGL